MMEMEGIRGIKGIRELNYKFIFICTNVIVENNQFNNEAGEDYDEQEDEDYAGREHDEDEEEMNKKDFK